MKEYDDRQLFTQIYKTYNLLKNQNPNKFTTHIKSSLVLPKNSSLTCKTFSQILKREHENESKIKQFQKEYYSQKPEKQKLNKTITPASSFRPLFIAPLRDNCRIQLINFHRKFAIDRTRGALSLAAGRSGRQLGPALTTRRAVIGEERDSSAHGRYAEETAGARVEMRCALIGENRGTTGNTGPTRRRVARGVARRTAQLERGTHAEED